MTEAPSWLWTNCSDVLRRSGMRSSDATVLVGRIAAWHLLQERLPADLRPPKAGEPLDGALLAEVWSKVFWLTELGGLRFAFAPDTATPFDWLSGELLAGLNQSIGAICRASEAEREQLALSIFDAWSLGAEPSELPIEVCEFAAKFLARSKGCRVLCYGTSANALGLAALRAGAVTTIFAPTAPVLACVMATIFGREIEVAVAETFEAESTAALESREFDVALVSPPWGERRDSLSRLRQFPSRFGVKTSEGLGLELASRLNVARAAIFSPSSLLLAKGPERELRSKLINQGHVFGVVAFPTGILRGSGIQLNLLVLSPAESLRSVRFMMVDETMHVTGQGKLRSRDRRLTDVEGLLNILWSGHRDEVRDVSAARIEAQDFNLSPARYLARPSALFEMSPRDSVPLGDLVEIIKPQFLAANDSADGVEIQEASPGDVPEYGYLEQVSRTRRVNARDLRSRQSQFLETNDLLLSTKGTIGKAGIAKPRPSSAPLLPSQSSVILRLRARQHVMDPRCLVEYLRSPIVQSGLKALAAGATIQNISLLELKKFPVWIFSQTEQQQLIDSFERQAAIHRQIDALKAGAAEELESTWEALGLRV